jgi:citrate lyase subunit beta/citryl-CoA lyase
MFRSLLFVPGDSDKKIEKSEAVAADVIILDLEDSVAPTVKPVARERVREYLGSRRSGRTAKLYVRINPLTTADALADLAAVMPGAPDGILQPKTGSPDDIIQLGHYLSAFEVQNGLVEGATAIIPVATEVPRALFSLGGMDKVGPRLAAVTWGAEDLSAAIGAIGNKDESGAWSQPFMLARSLCLFAASTAGVAALDTLHADFRDEAGLIASARRARRDGFSGKIAIHPAQVDAINSAFSPSADEMARARRIVDLFEANPGMGTLSLDGEMIDMPHLIQARKTLALARPRSS